MQMSEPLVLALIGSVTTIVVASIPIMLPRLLRTSSPFDSPYPWPAVLAIGLSIVAKVVATSTRSANSVKVYAAQTEPSDQPVGIDPAKRDYDGMIRYALNFPEPVDVVVPQQLSYTDKWIIWKVERNASDSSGRRWVVSFQVRDRGQNTGIAFASFIGLSFPK